jgi:hypothetical protein
MSKDPFVREIGQVSDAGGFPLPVGIHRGSVIIGDPQEGTSWALDATQAEEFARLFVRACWEAAADTDALERGARMRRISEFRR